MTQHRWRQRIRGERACGNESREPKQFAKRTSRKRSAEHEATDPARMTSSKRDTDGTRERLGNHDGLIGQSARRRFDVLVERQLGAVANHGRRDVIAECMHERREQLAGSVKPWQEEEMHVKVR